MDSASAIRLRQELVRDLKAADALFGELTTRAGRIASTKDPILMGWTALTLHQLYTAAESMFERICRAIEGTLPTGADTHHALLRRYGARASRAASSRLA